MNPGPEVIITLFNNPNLPITDTLLVSWLAVIIIVVFARLATRKLSVREPGLVQNGVELLIIAILDQLEAMLPGDELRFLPFIGTIFIFIGVGNLIGIIPGLTSPTGDLNTTLGLALVVFLVSHFKGMAQNGVWNYIKGFGEPIVFLFPLNVIGELAKPISHSFRLFGNVVGGGIIITLIYQSVPGLVPVPLHAWFDLFVGAIQALIFGMVAIAYISVAKGV